MAILVDTKILVRLHDQGSDQHHECDAFFAAIEGRPHPFVTSLQNIVEFWVVATRPKDANGLGFSVDEAVDIIHNVRIALPCLEEPAY